MDSNDLIKNLKIIIIIALIIAVIGAVLYLLYGLALVWQAIAAGIISGLLFLLVIVFIVISVYLWTRNYLLKRELTRYHTELRYCRTELAKYEKEPNNEN
jgi:membrane protein implicated in regulation of membrane protease activity